MRKIAVVIFFASSVMVAGLPPQPWLGMGVRSRRGPDGEPFLYVERVNPKGPADEAGLRPGDLITQIENHSLRHFGDQLDFLLFIADHKPGDRVRLTRIRSGQASTLVLTFGNMPASARGDWERGIKAARRNRIQDQAIRQ